jgi:hypothetical protein
MPRVNRALQAALAAGAGAAAYFALRPSQALATEDDTGTTVKPSEVTPPAPSPGAKPSIVTRAIEVLGRLVRQGVAETPAGSNRGKAVEEIQLGVHQDGKGYVGKPWCARTVRYAFEQAAVELGLPPPFAEIKSGLGAVTDWRDNFSRYQSAEPRPGMVGLIIGPKVRHATLVAKVDGNTVSTLEGNHEDRAAAVERKRGAFATFIDVEAYLNRARGGERVSGLELLGVDHVA